MRVLTSFSNKITQPRVSLTHKNFHVALLVANVVETANTLVKLKRAANISLTT